MKLESVVQLAITFLVIAIVLGMGASVIVSFRDQDSNKGVSALADSNSITADNVTATFFGDLDVKGYPPSSCTGVSIFNGSAAKNVTVDFTISTSACTALLTNHSYYEDTVQVNYTKNMVTYSFAYNFTQEGVEAQETMSSWQNTWVVIVAAAVVLGIIGAYLVYRQ